MRADEVKQIRQTASFNEAEVTWNTYKQSLFDAIKVAAQDASAPNHFILEDHSALGIPLLKPTVYNKTLKELEALGYKVRYESDGEYLYIGW